MNEADALDIVRNAVWTVVAAAGPSIAVAMFIGLIIALFQALTQIQEMTLTFIPKIVAILIMVAVTGPYMGSQIYALTEELYGRIEHGF
ncbi:flagellar biosynthesis protein FliQ [Polycladidibacter hongkongensis]|uniref:flagellar biosynthesis protein FliQ n=1 Tax=Polycladidibacter hongkongensis TaxID=1647556 RepID=UPI00082BEA51|nr:flagellar biosynthesis protein FliQ [Pseudovibrio hongkongensis]